MNWKQVLSNRLDRLEQKTEYRVSWSKEIKPCAGYPNGVTMRCNDNVPLNHVVSLILDHLGLEVEVKKQMTTYLLRSTEEKSE